VSNKTVVIWG